MTRRKAIDIVLSIFFAILLWAYVVNVVNPPATVTVKNVPVQLMNQEVLASSRLALSGNTNYTVDVVLSGTRSELNDVTANQLTATADLFGLSAGQNYLTVNVTCPSTMTVEEVRSQRIQVFIEDLVSVAKTVNLVIGKVDEGYEVTMEDTGPVTIDVSGAKSIVNKVTEIYAELDPADFPLDEITTLLLDAIPRDSEGNQIENVRLESSYVEVKGTVYATKTVALSINLTGDPGLGAEIDYSDLPSKIVIKGSQEALAAVRSISTQSIDINGMTEDRSVKLIPKLPDGIMLSDNTGSLKVVIKLTSGGNLDYYIDPSLIPVEGLNEEEFAWNFAETEENDIINIDVKGGLDVLKVASQELFIPSLDLSGVTEAGTYQFQLISPAGSEYTVTYEPEALSIDIVSILPEESEELDDPENPDNAEDTGSAEAGKDVQTGTPEAPTG